MAEYIMNRLTTDNPHDNVSALMNYAYAKDGRVYLSYADGEECVDLCEYIAKNACCEEINANAVMDGACMECDCKTAILNVVAIQAAELRARLKEYEDTGLSPEDLREICKLVDFDQLKELLKAKAEERFVVLPCKVGDTVYAVDGDEEGEWIDEYEVKYFYCSSRGVNRIYATCGTLTKNFRPKRIGKEYFLTREEAEAALKGGEI